jgi:hypothetical protein
VIIQCFIATLAIGDALVNYMRFVDYISYIVRAQCETRGECVYFLLVGIENIIKWYYHIVLLLVVVFYGDHAGKAMCCFWARLFMRSLAFSCCFQWFFLILIQIDSEYAADQDNNTNSTTTITSKTLFSAIEPFMFPLGIEYRIILLLEFANIALISNSSNFVPACLTTIQKIFSRRERISVENQSRIGHAKPIVNRNSIVNYYW